MSGRSHSEITTRRLGLRDGVEVRAVRRAVLEVVRGPDRGASLELGADESSSVGTAVGSDLRLRDDSVSHSHLEISFDGDHYAVRDLASTNGTRIGGALVRDAILDRTPIEIALGETVLRFRLLSEETEQELALDHHFGQVLGSSPAMRRVFEILGRACHSDSTVLLIGESGTGKEVLAQSLHERSPRAEGPFVVVDCGSLPPGLAESELFGHVRGAFTGADDAREGALAEASGGTLFLDEIGDLPMDLQPMLLRAIESREIRPVGADGYRHIDVRIVAATHRDLEQAVRSGTFRADLYYRLSVIRVTVPPLRQRRQDVPRIAQALLEQCHPDRDVGSALSPSILDAFVSYDWPGNVRELRNAIERLVVLGDPGPLESYRPVDYHQARRQALDDFERDYVAARLAEADGVVVRAAEKAGISRQMFHRLARRHGLKDG